jgi:hypothetical protein
MQTFDQCALLTYQTLLHVHPKNWLTPCAGFEGYEAISERDELRAPNSLTLVAEIALFAWRGRRSSGSSSC